MTSVRNVSKLSLGIAIASIVLTVVTVLGIALGIHNSGITKATLKSTDYVIGAVTGEGKLVESKQHLYSKELKTVEGLEIELDETAVFTYDVVFYDEDGNYVSTVSEQSADFDNANIPENAKTFRIVINAYEVDGEIKPISIFNKANYTKKITVRYDI